MRPIDIGVLREDIVDMLQPLIKLLEPVVELLPLLLHLHHGSAVDLLVQHQVEFVGHGDQGCLEAFFLHVFLLEGDCLVIYGPLEGECGLVHFVRHAWNPALAEDRPNICEPILI